jgi:biotin synthase
MISRNEIISLLGADDPAEIERIRSEAEARLLDRRGNKVFYRGLIEFSNRCICDCNYCGIRKSNANVKRYTLPKEEIISAAQWSAQQGYGSIVLQSGERNDSEFIDFLETAVSEIKSSTVSEKLPKGVGITLSVGEQSPQAYERFYKAGAHRYLLRIETSSPKLFASIHPPSQKQERRIECLKTLKRIGFRVGTGVMIGIPGQTVEDLADDILFFKEMDIDMIGMGPYIVHKSTPMSVYEDYCNKAKAQTFQTSLLMIAACRIALGDVNIASTTALQAMKYDGRELGLRYGANVIMPQTTPTEVRRDYLLYDGKPCLDEDAVRCRACLEARIRSVGREVALDEWGDL